MTLFLLAACRASTSADPEVEAVLVALEEEYPLAELADPLVKGAVGGVNLWAYCLSRGFPAVGYRKGFIEGPAAAHDNWVCQRGTEQLAPRDFEPIDMDDACTWQFGRERIVARPEEDDHAWTWSCYGT